MSNSTHAPKSLKSLLTATLAFTTLLVMAAASNAQVGVYRMNFKETGSSLNFDFYTGGYFVCGLPEGTGTFIFTIEENTRKLYTTSVEGGELFFVNDGDIRMASIGATGGNIGNASSALLVTGSTFDSTNIGGGIRMPVVKKLSGTFLAYIMEGTRKGNSGGSTTDGSTTTNTSSTSTTNGLAGFANASFTFDAQLTRRANADLLTVADTVTLVTKYLELNRYEKETDDSSGDSGTTTDTTNSGTPISSGS